MIHDKLELSVFMRSQDVWWGTPYDWFQFTQLQHTAARALDVEVGIYRHTTVSTHIYDRFIPEAEQVIAAETPLPADRELQPTCFGQVGDDIWRCVERARQLGTSKTFDRDHGATDSERWYADVLAPIVG